MMSKKNLNVFYVVDFNFIIHFTVSLTSILENNKHLNISVFVLHDLEELSLLETIKTFFEISYSIQITFTRIENKLLEDVPVSALITKAAYYRLLLADIIPNNISEGLYIDCDTITTGPLDQLAEIQFRNNANIQNPSILIVRDKNEPEEIERLHNFGINTSIYFNSGVMMLNLKEWRKEKVSTSLIKIAEQYKSHLKWHDQDVLNIFFKNSCGILNKTYNTLPGKKLKVTPIILHFSGPSKPWRYISNGPYKYLYWKYLKLTPFKKQKFDQVTLKSIKIKYINMIKSYLSPELQ